MRRGSVLPRQHRSPAVSVSTLEALKANGSSRSPTLHRSPTPIAARGGAFGNRIPQDAREPIEHARAGRFGTVNVNRLLLFLRHGILPNSKRSHHSRLTGMRQESSVRVMDTNNLLVIEQVAIALGCSTTTVHRYVSAGLLHPMRLLGRTVYDKAEVERVAADLSRQRKTSQS